MENFLMRNVFLGIILSIIIILSWASINLGVFKPVFIKVSSYPEMFLLYKEHVGPYHQIVHDIEVVEKWAAENNLNCQKSFGHFLDNPEIKEHARLKSHVGCWLPQKISFLQPSPYVLPEGFHFKVIPPQEYIIAEFLGSPAIGPFKVYGEVNEYFAEHKWGRAEDVLEVYERYDKDKIKTYYLFKKLI
jgi:AraC family transcriptional regulator